MSTHDESTETAAVLEAEVEDAKDDSLQEFELQLVCGHELTHVVGEERARPLIKGLKVGQLVEFIGYPRRNRSNKLLFVIVLIVFVIIAVVLLCACCSVLTMIG